MDRRYHWLAALLLFLLLLGCSGQTTEEPAVPVLNLAREKLTDRQAIVLQEQALGIAADCQPCLQKMEGLDPVAALIDHFAARGMTVIDGDNLHNMQNAEAALAFGQAIRSDRDASVTIYQIYPDGGFRQLTLEKRGDIALATGIRIAWDPDLTPRVTDISRRDIEELSYTEKGYLIFRLRELDSVAAGPDYVPYQMIRVEPLEDVCRQLCRTYIRPAGYANSNLFLTDWQTEDYGDLVWNDVFPICYFLQTGTLLTAHTPGDYIFTASGLMIPPEDYYRYIGIYFPVSAQELQSSSCLDVASGCYPTRIFTSGDMRRRLPTPEVVAWRENADGSLYLTVEALDSELGTDCAFRHGVTILPQEDGTWKYLANQLLAGAPSALPAYENTYATTG